MSQKNNLYYRKTDRKAILLLLVVAITAITLIYLSGSDRYTGVGGSADSAATKAADSIQKRRFHRAGQPYYYAGERHAELFPFDPNTADSTTLLRLGMRPWVVRNIYRYRAKGGIFTRPSDFARIYGLTTGEYRRLKPYIRISPDYQPATSLPEATLQDRDSLKHPVKLTKDEYVVLNTADTTQLKRVPGIGSFFAYSIVAYGARLGGYVDVNQLDEIDDFPQESKSYFIISNPQTVKLNVNKLSIRQLSRHPYITFHQAKAIADYRRLKGPLRSLQDLRLHRDFNDEAIKRLEPYVEF